MTRYSVEKGRLYAPPITTASSDTQAVPYIEVAVGERLEEILAEALPNQITLESDMTFLVKAVQNWYGKFGERISFPRKPRLDVIPGILKY